MTVKERIEQLAGVTGSLAKYALWVAGTSLVLMTALVFWQVFTRYVLGVPAIFTEPLSILMMGWFIFLGAAVGTKEGYHLSFDILLMVLPAKAGNILQYVSDVLVACFGFGMLFYGGALMLDTWAAPMASLGLPTGLALLPVTVGGALIILFSLERMARRAVGLKTARFGESADDIAPGAVDSEHQPIPAETADMPATVTNEGKH
jgi:TRAP-type C4-dicarboxylate transport system permease small subunit